MKIPLLQFVWVVKPKTACITWSYRHRPTLYINVSNKGGWSKESVLKSAPNWYIITTVSIPHSPANITKSILHAILGYTGQFQFCCFVAFVSVRTDSIRVCNDIVLCLESDSCLREDVLQFWSNISPAIFFHTLFYISTTYELGRFLFQLSWIVKK